MLVTCNFIFDEKILLEIFEFLLKILVLKKNKQT